MWQNIPYIVLTFFMSLFIILSLMSPYLVDTKFGCDNFKTVCRYSKGSNDTCIITNDLNDYRCVYSVDRCPGGDVKCFYIDNANFNSDSVPLHKDCRYYYECINNFQQHLRWMFFFVFMGLAIFSGFAFMYMVYYLPENSLI